VGLTLTLTLILPSSTPTPSLTPTPTCSPSPTPLPLTRWELRKTKGVGETDFHLIKPDAGEEVVVTV